MSSARIAALKVMLEYHSGMHDRTFENWMEHSRNGGDEKIGADLFASMQIFKAETVKALDAIRKLAYPDE